MPRFACNEDLRRAARRRVPKMFYDYVDGGSWTESTYRANAGDLADIKLRQRVARDVSTRTAKGRMVGQDVRMPVAMAPTGLTGMFWPNGEVHAMRACEEFGVPYCLSTVSIASLEEVAQHATSPFWFQLYVIRDRDFIERLLQRCEAVGIDTIVLTLDLQMVGQRNKDIHNGLSSPPAPTLRNLLNLATKPQWCWDMLRHRQMQFGNIHGHVADVGSSKTLAKWTDSQFDPTLNWDDVKYFRDRWKGKLILKGIIDPEDTELACQTGCDAIVVSNHGGRQLDGAASTIHALPSVVEAAKARTEILIDGGFTSGQDVFKGLAYGASGVMMGRSMLYGLGAAKQAGVVKALDLIKHELETTMGLCGVNRIEEIGRHNILAVA
ncbi:alpha-hydroxy acid oxidase [Marinovum algicola]|mgnify:CR=1 FL=1|uniref:alpha-hydroxy acid oxidase n=1 Tax=Marinovum algicola TaxID=42444 RepID=UPI0024BA3756|nr:alpha-hydroxy acid oxidase [Marinovum algicola]